MTPARRLLVAVVLAGLAGWATAADAPGPAAGPAASPERGLRVVDGAGRALAGAALCEALEDAEGHVVLDADAPPIAVSDVEGRIPAVPEASSSRARRVVCRDGHVPALVPASGGGLVVLLSAATLSGHVRGARGAAPPSAYVFATPLDGGAFAHVVRLDADGRFTVTRASAGRWRLELRRLGGAWSLLGVATAGTPLPPVTLPTGALVRGRVMDGDARRPAAGLTVRLRRHDAARGSGEAPVSDADTAAEAVCDADGRFVVADLPVGLYAGSLADGLRAWDGPPPRFEVAAAVPRRLETWWVVRRGVVTGTVADARDRRPLPDALVRVVAPPDADPVEGGRVPTDPVRTGGDGRFVVPGVVPGEGYRVVVEAAGRSPVVSDPFDVLGGRESRAGRVLLPVSWRLEVTVVDAEERAIEGASVVVSPASRPAPDEGDPVAAAVLRSADTDASGRAVVRDLAVGDARVRVRKAGFVDAAAIAPESGPGGARDVRVRLARTLAVEGRLEATDGPLPAVVVRALPRDGAEVRTARAAADGRFRVEDLGPAAVDVEVVSADGPTGLVYARRDAVLPGSGETLVIPVPGARRVSGLVDGVRLDGPAAVVRLEAARYDPARDGDRPVVVAETRLPTGSGALPFVFPGVPPGPYALRAVQGRRDTGPVPTTVGDGEVGGIDLRLPEGGEIGGLVFDGVRGVPALGARVDLVRVDGEEDAPVGAEAPAALTTDDDGRFTARDLAPGLWRIDARDEDRVAPPVVVRLAEGASAFVRDLRLSGGGRVEGRVEDGHHGPLAGLVVRIHRAQDLAEVAQARTDDDGAFRSGPLVPGRYRLRVRAGLATEGALEADVEVSEGETTRVVWAPSDTGRIDGTVRRRGTTVAGVTVEAAFEGGTGVERVLLRTVTDASGQYAWDGLAEGTYELRLLDGAVRARTTVRLGRGDRATRDLELGEGRISGRVARPDGTPWRGVVVTAFPVGTAIDQEEAETGRVRTGPDGTFAIAGLPVGRYRVAVLPEGRTARVFDGVLADLPGSERPLEVVLGAGATLDVDVRDAGGRGVGAAEVWVEDATGAALHTRPVVTPASGRVRVEGVPDGPVRVTVHARGYGRPPAAAVTARDGTTTPVRVTLRPAGTLRLVVTAGRDPVARARVDVRRAPDGEVVAVRRPLRRADGSSGLLETSRTGVLVLDDLEEGAYLVVVTAGRELEPARLTVRVGAGEETVAHASLRFVER